MRKKSIRLSLGMIMLGLAMVCLLAPTQAAAVLVPVTIDDYTIPFGSQTNPPLSSTAVTPVPLRAAQPPPALPTVNVLGNNRILELEITAMDNSEGVTYIDGSSDPNLRAWSVGNLPGSTGKGRIIWNGSNVTSNPLACSLPQPSAVGYCADCTWDKFYSLRLEQLFNDLDTTWRVRLYSAGGGVSEASFFRIGQTAKENREILRAAFVGTVDFANICAIDITMDAVNSLDTTITQVTAMLDIPEPPNIFCVSKTIGPSPFNPATQVQNLVLPKAPSFDGDLYIQVTVKNGVGASATPVDVRDTLPAGMTFLGDVQVQSPAGFNLGSPNVGVNTVEWQSVSSLGPDQTLQFSFKVHLTLPSPGSVTNISQAKARSDAQYPTSQCNASVTLPGENKVPGLNEWGAIILSLLLAASAVWLLRKRRVS